MIITQTPFRISFFGGGTDYRPYFEEYGGSVLSTTIDKYCYISVRYLPPFFDHKLKIAYSKIEAPNDIDEIEHPSVKACLRFMRINNVSISHDGDLPARTGLGSSSAFTVGLLHALHTLKGQAVDKMTLAQEAVYVEQNLIKENVGVQDQLAAALGGLNRMYFSADELHVRPLVISPTRRKELNRSLMLFYTGISRFASEIAQKQVENISIKKRELMEIQNMVEIGEKILTQSSDINDFGKLLHESWLLKKSLTDKISTSAIDEIYQTAIKNGALGGKLLGAGGGGFILFFVEPEKQEMVKKALSYFLYVPFRFEGHGSRIIYYKS